MDGSCMVGDGHYVIVKKENFMKLLQVTKGSKVRFGKMNLRMDGMIGHPYGSVFEIQKDGTLCLSYERPDVMVVAEIDDIPTGDNREITAKTDTQKLDAEDIEKLKQDGAHGDEIIKRLVENSESFQQRTEFSQAKYLKRKEKKYLRLCTVLRPCARLVCEVYLEKSAPKIMQLRVDSLAQLLLQSNVQAGSRIIVADTCQGLVLGAVLERMAGVCLTELKGAASRHGECIHLYQGDANATGALEYFNFSDAQRAIVRQYPVEKLGDVATLAGTEEGEVDQEWLTLMARKEQWDEATMGKWDTIYEQRILKRTQARQARRNAVTSLARKEFDGLVIATKFCPKQMLLALWPYLGQSRPFSVFFPLKEPLVEAYQAMRNEGSALRLELFETWTRPYQVLPLRTHPTMSMNANSGFVLAGIKIRNEPSTAQPVPGKGPRQKRTRT